MSGGQLEALRAFYPDAQEWSDGGRAVFYIPKLPVRTRERTETVAALLYPHPKDNYASRLYLDRQIAAKAGWTSCVVCGSTWHACSWQGVSATLPIIEVLRGHLGAFS